MPGSFLDTNILVYLTLDDSPKNSRARELIAAGAIVSVQVLNELANVARRKRQRSWKEVVALIDTLLGLLEVQTLTVRTHVLGLEIAERYNVALYDAMLLSAALLADCDTFWSEGMHDGLVIEGRLTIRNPFAKA